VLREGLLDSSESGISRARSVEKLNNRARASVEKACRLARQAARADEALSEETTDESPDR
ncbi:MAG: hypothetical protein ACYDBS_02455, partial [Acidimicrobiales bacterium]